MYFANPSTEKVREAMRAGLLACIVTPKQGNKHVDGALWCADNGCFGKGYPGDDEWFNWLRGMTDNAATCLFAVAPDVVGDAAATLTRSRPWLSKIRSLGYPAAFVAQDGIENTTVPWAEFDVLFIGGSTSFKLGKVAARFVAEAKLQGKEVHMGRVNSAQRMRYAQSIACDSADGTFIAFGPDINLPKVLGWLASIEAPCLF